MIPQLLLAVLLPALASVLLVFAEQKSPFARLPDVVRQGVIGVAFGSLVLLEASLTPALLLTPHETLPLAAGLFFGAPAGLIAGCLGSVLLYCLVPAEYAHLAGVFTLLLSGVIGALVRRCLLEDCRPGPGYSLLVPNVVAVLHLSLVFFTNAADANVFEFVRSCLPLILPVSCGSMLLTQFLVRLAGHPGPYRPTIRSKEQRSINETFQFWLFVIVFSSLLITEWFTWTMLTTATQSAVDDLLLTNLQDMRTAVSETAAQTASAEDRRTAIADTARNRHIWEEGYFIVCDENGTIVSGGSGHTGENLLMLRPDNAGRYQQSTTYRSEFYGVDCYWAYTHADGYLILALLPYSEAMFSRDVGSCLLIFVEILVYAFLFAQITVTVRKVVVENMRKLNASLAKITAGELEEKADVRTCLEFVQLSDDINQTVDTLKHYIAEAAARVDQELELARQIQHAALPSTFPPFPHRSEFSIYASMDTAREVGGDFYDFYLLEENRLAFLIADVSGKGIPAAMFMMTAKAFLKSSAESGLPVEQVFTQANHRLCEGNEADMFVTAWMGVLDLSTGRVRYANAGHNPPLLRRKDGELSYLRTKPGFVLGGMDGIRYRCNELVLEPGDVLFLYTDGVTEAHNSDQQLYGEGRLLACLAAHPDLDVQRLCETVKKDVDRFAGSMEQFDDLSMLCVCLNSLPESTGPQASDVKIP